MPTDGRENEIEQHGRGNCADQKEMGDEQKRINEIEIDPNDVASFSTRWRPEGAESERKKDP